ncbi:MAG TPA: RNA methyltransferase, partial [Caldilineaceae bacterium]|nr:RNA methyltransferase [Caldilineaceae bacterium]
MKHAETTLAAAKSALAGAEAKAIEAIAADPGYLPAHLQLTDVYLYLPQNWQQALRSAEAAGVDWVLFTPGTVDPFNDKVVRAAMGAHFRLPLSVCADWMTVRQMLPAGQALYLADPGAELLYDQVDWPSPAVLVVGGEAGGASAELRALATPVRIPMHGAVESLNAAVAGAVVLFEAARQRRMAYAQP